MAEFTQLRSNVLDFPVYGLPYTVVLPMLDADGDLVTGATTPDAEISKNGDTFADCTNESTEIATSSGIYYLHVTAAELTTDAAAIIAKSATTGMKTTPLVLYPVKLPVLLDSANAGAYDSATTINLGSGASATDDYYNGAIVYIYGGTGYTAGSVEQVRMITDYVGSTKIATVHVAWATNPDATSDVRVYATPIRPVLSAVISGTINADVVSIHGDATAAANAESFFDGTGYAGTNNVIPTVTTVSGLAAGAVDSILDEVVEGSYTMRQMIRMMASALLGKVSGGGTTTITFRDTGDSTNRIVATVDASGNRTAVTLTAT